MKFGVWWIKCFSFNCMLICILNSLSASSIFLGVGLVSTIFIAVDIFVTAVHSIAEGEATGNTNNL